MLHFSVASIVNFAFVVDVSAFGARHLLLAVRASQKANSKSYLLGGKIRTILHVLET